MGICLLCTVLTDAYHTDGHRAKDTLYYSHSIVEGGFEEMS